ncbi:MAG TPA: hypothetical protein VHO69_18200 [Phototrophicaceae bacterium]|nr:hypothetical protein [Phototrophicaceae bacterium]
MTPLCAYIRGIQDNPAVTEINIRAGAGTQYDIRLKAPVGLSNLGVLEARRDEQGGNFQGKIYQWLRLAFPDGQEGWARDDLLEIVGDGSFIGYGVVSTQTYAFALTRDESAAPLAPGQHIAAPVGQRPEELTAPAPVITPATVPAPVVTPAISDAAPAVPVPPPVATPAASDRVRRAAFNITSAFEGGGYATYQNYDSGIISYGRFQFTLAAGSFVTVVKLFIERSTSPVAVELQNYWPRISAQDANLRGDTRLKELLLQAAQEKIMQDVQDQVAAEGYYQPVVELSILPRNIQTPLAYALIFDMAINHGRYNHLVPKTEEVLGVPPKSRLVENGVSEQQFIQTMARLRQENLYALAAKLNLPGLKPRGDFWVALVASGDWELQGDTNGNLNINGKIVQVRNP